MYDVLYIGGNNKKKPYNRMFKFKFLCIILWGFFTFYTVSLGLYEKMEIAACAQNVSVLFFPFVHFFFCHFFSFVLMIWRGNVKIRIKEYWYTLHELTYVPL